MMKWALVTGTTVGIGASFCDLLAKNGYNIVSVSRDRKKMEENAVMLRAKYGVEVEVLVADLSDIEAIRQVESRCLMTSKPIEVLVNNAAFGINDSFDISPIAVQEDMVQVMISAPMILTHAVLNGMKQRKKGYIINVSSVASVMVGSTYCAAKSWLSIFSESLSRDLLKYGINVHASCVGFTRTEFHQRMGQDVSWVPNMFWLDSDRVANDAWKAVQKGIPYQIPAAQYKLLIALHHYAPRFLVRIYAKIALKFLGR